eukprot:245864_1
MAQSDSTKQTIPKPKYVEVNVESKSNTAFLFQESKVHRSKSETVKQIEEDSQIGITDIESLLLKVQKDVDTIASDFVEFDTCIQTRVMDMMRSSKEHMEWLKMTTQATSLIAQKAADHAEIFRSECQKLNKKCQQLDSFEKFLEDIQSKLTLLETSADGLMGVELK